MAAKVYVHNKRGFQVRFTLYFPDGEKTQRYRYLQTRPEADLVCHNCDFLERGSRSGSLSSREIIQGRHDGLLSEADAQRLSGGRVSVGYDLDKVFEQYIATITVSHSASALSKAAGRATWIKVWLESHPIPLLTNADVNRYVLDRRSGALSFKNPRSGFARVGVRPKTIKNEVDVLSGIVEEAVRLRMVETNIVKGISVPVKTSKLRRAMSLIEIKLLLASAEEHGNLMHGQVLPFIHLALYTGFRRSELRTLSWDDVNLETHRIMVQSKSVEGEDDFTAKSGAARFKSIPDALLPVLAGMERRGRFVFGGDAPYSADVISQTIKRLMKIAGLPEDLSLHHCRHTYGSWLLRKTGDLKLVQDEMGHLDVATTKKYAHTIENVNDPARAFDYE